MLEVALFHRFPRFTLRVNFRAAAEVVVLFGPSGAGKTLTVRAIAGLFQPQQGRVCLHGDIWLDTERKVNLPPQRRRVGYVPQHLGLFPHLTVRENIAFGLRRLPRLEREQRVAEMLALMQLEAVADQPPDRLSGGQQQRVALARALAARPKILLLDEALNHLDPVLRQDLGRAIRRIHERFRLPVVFITHDIEEAYTLADRLVVLEQGQVVQTGTPDEIFRRPATLLLARAVDMRNLFPATVERHGPDTTHLRWGGGLLRAPRVPLPPGARVWVGIRPEDVLFVGEARLLRPTLNLLEGTVVEVYPAGTSTLVRLNLGPGGQILWARVPPMTAANLGLRPGRRCRLLLPRQGVHVFPGEMRPAPQEVESNPSPASPRIIPP